MTGWVADRGLGTKKKRGGQDAENTQHWVTVYVGVEITKNYEKMSLEGMTVSQELISSRNKRELSVNGSVYEKCPIKWWY